MSACSDDTGTEAEGSETSTPGDGDPGDGDGDPGDGDGDPGDGDGDPGDGDPGDGDGDPGGDEGYCGLTCATVDDCDVGLGTDGWSCDGGFCSFTAPECDPNADGTAIDFTDCFGQPANCVPVGGTNTCVQVSGCADDQACEDAFLAGWTCTGADDNSTAYCEPPAFTCNPGDPCEGGFGTCNDAGDACVCATDDECTAEGTACNV